MGWTLGWTRRDEATLLSKVPLEDLSERTAGCVSSEAGLWAVTGFVERLCFEEGLEEGLNEGLRGRRPAESGSDLLVKGRSWTFGAGACRGGKFASAASCGRPCLAPFVCAFGLD